MPVARPELQVGEQVAAPDEAFLAQAPRQRHRWEHGVLVPAGEPRRAVDARRQREEILVLEPVVQPGHVRLQRPRRQVTAHAVDVGGGPDVVELLSLVGEPGRVQAVVLGPLLLDAVQQRDVDAVVAAHGVAKRQDVVQRVCRGAVVPQPRVRAAALIDLGLGSLEYATPVRAHVAAEVHSPGECVRQAVVGEQGAGHQRVRPVVDPVLDVREGVHALPVGGRLEQEVPRAVIRHGERVVEERLAVDAVASAQVLVGPDQRR